VAYSTVTDLLVIMAVRPVLGRIGFKPTCRIET